MRVGLHYEPKGNTKMKRFKATIKEKGMDGVIRTQTKRIGRVSN